jgi:glycerol-3-phosphate dehydrogenase
VVTARSDALQALADERFDVAVIGGGIIGARFHAEARAAEIVAGASSGRARVA